MLRLFKSHKNDDLSELGSDILIRNNISLLILDERWNGLFQNISKTDEIIQCEEEIRELLKEQSKLIAEKNEIPVQKRKCLDRIIELTAEAYDKNNKSAQEEMEQLQKKIKEINHRLEEINERLEALPEDISRKNMELLNYAVKVVYLRIRGDQLRIQKLDKQIEEMKAKLQSMIEERASLDANQSEAYSYFHDLLGGEILEKLDRKYFGE